VDDTLRAVRRFVREARRRAEKLDNRHPLRLIAIATSAVREADNRDRLLGPLRREHGVEARVLTGAEEARLGASAAIEDHPRLDGVVGDLGGGSFQLTAVRGGRIAGTASLPLGAVRLTRAFLHNDPPEPRELRGLRSEIRRHLEDALPPARRGEVMVGLGGTIRTLARMHLAGRRKRRKNRSGLRLDQSDITEIRERLEGASQRERRHFRGLRPERADTMLAGAILVEEALVFGGYLTLVVSTRGVRDGLLLRETFDGAR